MLQVARLSPKLLGDSSELVVSFLLGQLHPGGAFRNRAGDPDLYYTVFGLDALIAMQAEPPVAEVCRFLQTFGNGEGLDLVHLACLARAWAGVSRRVPEPLADGILTRLEKFRTAEGGFGTAYAAYLAIGAYQDLQQRMPESEMLYASLQRLRAQDGGFANVPGAAVGITTATAAMVTIARQLSITPDPALGQWLLARAHREGGFLAAPSAPIPDLLSTATALHALAVMHVPLDGLRESCLDFVDSLWTNRGGFYGHWSDDAIDTEYTFYALLALGHLAV